jgi:ATP-binding cassette subfamily G (WHITE) protein 2 (SNQ2)
MLEVIGAGATAIAGKDWHQIWQASHENEVFRKELEMILVSGRNRPAVEVDRRTEFPTSWGTQVIELIKRDAAYHYRDVNYLFAKLILNVFSGLFIGFSFFKKENSIQGFQNKIFVSPVSSCGIISN